ncbi:TlyA family RNA methyltransferase [Nitrospira defluvii]|nr:TlyA family RNA methyltransferase [Nitrospira defluvii]
MPSLKKSSKERLDTLLFQRELAESREKAKALILSGAVIVNGSKIERAGTKVDPNAEIVLLKKSFPYVSRGGIKMESALNAFDLDVSEMVAIDVGASTGGFTDCLLIRGAKRVYAVDVGYGQLAWSLRNDPRVVVLERQNIRYLQKGLIPEQVDLVTIDVSFISLKKVIPAIVSWLKEAGVLIALIKPQFEVGKGAVGKGGIVTDPKLHQAVVEDICQNGSAWKLKEKGLIPSPITGQKGNREFFVYFQKLAS